jgi:hypothetical protein
MKRLIIFDADSMVFTVAYRYRDKKAKHLVTMNLNKYISEVISNSGATHYIGYYGSKEDGAEPNFRYDVYEKYKANRPETPEWVEKWRPALHDEMKNKWSFVPVDGMEADDAVSISAHYFKSTGEFDEIVVATEDKDLKQIPGVIYYNLRKHTQETIVPLEGHRHLAMQTLSGDSTDNIPGLPGIGPKKAEKIVSACTSVMELKKNVIQAYKDSFDALLKKLQTTNKVVTEDDLKAEYEEKGMTLSPKQLQRKLKILNKGAGDEIYEIFPGGWKNFLRMNYTLVRMLVRTNEAPTSFAMPEPVETKIGKNTNTQGSADVEAAKKALFGDTDDSDPEEAPFGEEKSVETTEEPVEEPEMKQIGTVEVITQSSINSMSL